MPSTKHKKSKKLKTDSNDSDSEHELFYYAKDRVKLMKEVLKLIKAKKIKAMAPDCIKNLDSAEINSMLLEELLGISNKRLRYIFNGENVDRETSSSESEEETQPVDIISLDDISDDDDIEICISTSERKDIEGRGKDNSKGHKKHKTHKIKREPKGLAVKLEKPDKDSKKRQKDSTEINVKQSEKEKLMSVLELLELQARARAIRSQLAIEADKRPETCTSEKITKVEQEDSSDSDVIVESPKPKEIIISSSDSEEESNNSQKTSGQDNVVTESLKLQQNVQEIIDLNVETSNSEDKTEVNASGTEHQLMKRKDFVTNNSKDKTKSNTSDTEDELVKRKKELLTKVRKIRLIRSRVSKEQKQKDLEEPAPNINTLDEKPTEMESNDDLLKNDVGVDEGKNANPVLNICKTIVDTEMSPPKQSEEIEATTAKTDNNDCENDEIVIDLDEDEMSGMVND